ncbi:hypothetical protein K461DRAFT_131484 [Myriangium duriaei CBS 260.36]|uniref:Uncharacterized protein n=1 Tax=Myriangium duriaei CBS 260.36 TaxID=1168546 RepID=A0A9P4J5V5_9PEZI|nr:hypothetical protein K461DRAFT_131484 [Myriangium duriaei CBS 260.36]
MPNAINRKFRHDEDNHRFSTALKRPEKRKIGRVGGGGLLLPCLPSTFCSSPGFPGGCSEIPRRASLSLSAAWRACDRAAPPFFQAPGRRNPPSTTTSPPHAWLPRRRSEGWKTKNASFNSSGITGGTKGTARIPEDVCNGESGDLHCQQSNAESLPEEGAGTEEWNCQSFVCFSEWTWLSLLADQITTADSLVTACLTGPHLPGVYSSGPLTKGSRCRLLLGRSLHHHMPSCTRSISACLSPQMDHVLAIRD